MPKSSQPKKLKKSISDASNTGQSKVTILEKDLVFFNPSEVVEQCSIVIPSVQTCICLIMWHQGLCAITHANGTGNEVAAYKFMINKFEEKNIKSEAVKVYMFGGYYNNYHSGFFKESITWIVRDNSNPIAHPMLNVLKKHHFTILPENQKRHASPDEGNFCITFSPSSGNSIDDFTVTNTFDERAYMKICGDELERRNEDVGCAVTRIKDPNSCYQIFEIKTQDKKSMLNYTDEKTPSNNCLDSYTTWFPSP